MLLPLLLTIATAGPGNPDPAPGTIRNPATEGLARFGTAVALASPTEALVGEPSSDGHPGGLVHVYRRSAGSWESSAVLTVAGAGRGTSLGSTLAVDGNTLLVGMRRTAPADSARGGVRRFVRGSDGRWTDAGELGTPAARSGYGSALAISGDWAYVGAPNTAPAGVVHVFRRSGSNWTAAGTITADGAAGDRFGSSISVDGDRIAVGAPGRDAQKGAVYVFRRGADGSFAQEGTVAARRAAANSQVGAVVLLRGDRLWASGSVANAFVGMVAGFARNTAGEWSETATLVPFETVTSRFGTSLTMVGDELWVGAPFSDGREGRIYRASFDRRGAVSSMTKLATDSLNNGSGFGGEIAVAGNTIAVGMAGDAGGEGTVVFLDRNAAGNWVTSGRVFPAAEGALAAITGAEQRCSEDAASGYPCSNTALLSFLPTSAIGGGRGSRLSGNWGWTDPETGRDYALVGRSDGTSFVDVTDPLRPRYIGDMPRTPGANASSWREMKTYRNYLLVVSDGSGPHGVQIFDLTRLRGVTTPRTWEPDVVYDRVASVHNILTNDESGYAYAVGSNGGGEICGGGYHIIDMREPLKPTFAGCFADTQTGRTGTGYSHDAICVMYHGPDADYRGREICVGSNETALSITDLTDKQNMKVISRATYPTIGYTHQGWWTEDHRYFYVNDELDEVGGLGKSAEATRTLVFDFADLDDPVLVKEHLGPTKASDHNLYVKGNRMYQSNYNAGLRILDISDPANPREVGHFDVAPETDAAGFSGTWNNYPYFRNGSILVTSIENGMYLVRDLTQVVP